MPSHAATLRSLGLACLLVTLSCGDPRDRPQDCTANEFFNEVDALCERCPALIEPSCRAECPILVTRDERGCPEAACDLSCSACAEGLAFSLDTLSCEPRCSQGQVYLADLDRCVVPECETLRAQDPTSCDDLDCACSLLVVDDPQGCPRASCGQCADPQSGATVDEQGRCIPSP